MRNYLSVKRGRSTSRDSSESSSSRDSSTSSSGSSSSSSRSNNDDAKSCHGSKSTHLADFLFDSAVRHPRKVCVEDEEDTRYTFAELADLALALQQSLQALLGCSRQLSGEPQPLPHCRRASEEIISVVLPRGATCIAAVHAVMLEGKPYNCFDLANPREVLAVQLEVGEPRAVISSAVVAHRLDLDSLLHAHSRHTRLLDVDQPLLGRRQRTVSCVSANASSPSESFRTVSGASLPDAGGRLAYVIFTSGSTGKPKAVMIEHGSACNQVQVFGDAYGLKRDDRVCQSMSMAFDPHVIEIFCSLRRASTLVIMSDAMKRSGPDMLPWLIKERISVLTMTPSGYRMMMAPDVDVSRRGLPDLRICGSGGEALGREVLDSWAIGRKFFNLYGPTETTVTSAFAELRPGDPIVIGRSYPTYLNVVLDASTLAPVAPGERGVLFTGGPGVARGYLNDEGKTRERFVEVPGIGRAYNTGDVVSQDEAGNFHWIGRADFQVKVRGNRIELEYLEHAIMNVPGVTHCEARVVGNGARLVLLASGEGLTEAALKTAASKLGRAYELSVVKIVEADAWSFSVNGQKLLRNTVPIEDEGPPESVAQECRVCEMGGEELAELGAAAVAMELASSIGVALQSPDDDFFSSGGTSVTAATLVSKLRQLGKRHECMRQLKQATVRDIYECRTMGKLAEHLDESLADPRRLLLGKTRSMLQLPEDVEVVGTERFYLVSFLQALWIFGELGAISMTGVKLMFLVHSCLHLDFRFRGCLVAAALLLGLVPALLLCQAVLIKAVKVLLCFRPSGCMQIRLWSLHYLRWWVVHHMLDMVPTVLIAGTPYAAWWAWFMGARVGRDVVLWTVPKNADLELLDLGDGVNVGQESYFNTTHAEKGLLILGPIKVGAGASIGCRVNVAQHATIEAGATVEDLTLVSGNFAAPATDLEAGSDDDDSQEGARPFGCCMGLAMLPVMGGMFMLYSFLLPMYTTSWLIGGGLAKLVAHMAPSAGFWAGVVINVVAGQLVAVVEVILLKWLLVGRLRPGTFTVGSLKYWRFWLMQNLVGFIGAWLPLTLMTIYYPMLLRLLGARLGTKTEFGAFTFGYTPDLLKLGSGVFFADRCSVGGVHMSGGVCELKQTVIADRSFVGNLAVVKAGSDIQQDALLGIMSLAPQGAAAGTSWLGVPPIQLPGRQADVSQGKTNLTYKPSCLVYTLRLLMDFLRGQVPPLIIFLVYFAFNLGPEVLSTRSALEETPRLWDTINEGAEQGHVGRFWVWVITLKPYAQEHPHGFFFWIGVGLWGVLCVLVLCTVLVLVKWASNGRIKPASHTLYSFRVAMLGFNLALQMVAFPFFQLSFGTPFMGLFLRLVGASVGTRAFVNTMMIAEPDLVSIGDNVCLNRQATLGTHTFEDRVMKLDRIVLEHDTAVGCESAVLRGAALRERAVVEDSTLCMVDEELLRGRHRGCPSQRCS